MNFTNWSASKVAAESRWPLPGEIAFLESYGVEPRLLAKAADIADYQRVSPEQALLDEGFVSEKRFYSALADHLGVPYWDGSPPAAPGVNVNSAIASGFVPLAARGAGPRAVVAPRGPSLRMLLETPAEARGRLPIAVASRQRLGALLRAQCGEQVAHAAAEALSERDRALSAKNGATALQLALLVLALGLVAIGAVRAPIPVRLILSLVFWAIFSSAVWLRSIAVAARDSSRASARLSDAELPVYTVIAAIYREGPIVQQLVRALTIIDYPRAKLDIKLVVERDDRETLDALVALRLPARFDVIVAPRGAPMTKPRALNIALGVARGSLLVVYDAEDRPAPDQLRLAAERFDADPDLDCLQARLVIENARDGWLSEMFAVEYATLFDLINPGLAALHLPIALGGTSNHFRVPALRQCGGWDAWNVTEDADLGLRLARFGLKVEALASDTLEEAPNEWLNWFRQRVRWQKGWMQTLIVHSRHPSRVIEELGQWRALSAFALIGGGVSGGLFGVYFTAETLVRIFISVAWPNHSTIWYGDIVTIGLLLWGAQSVIVPTALAMRLRRMKGLGRVLATMPFYYALIAVASWTALIELVFRPFYWGKTDHGRSHGEPASSRPVAASAEPWL
ncbi:MAG: glycosyltransferase [Roseiarcus sp.]